MGWCLECHRAPEKNLRPVEQVYNLNWDARKDGAETAKKLAAAHPDLVFKDKNHPTQEEIGKGLKAAWNINAPESCSACHR
jgi:hypothetical protein